MMKWKIVQRAIINDCSALDVLVMNRRKEEKYSTVSDKKIEPKQCLWVSYIGSWCPVLHRRWA